MARLEQIEIWEKRKRRWLIKKVKKDNKINLRCGVRPNSSVCRSRAGSRDRVCRTCKKNPCKF